MDGDAALIIEVAEGSAVERQLRQIVQPAGADVVVVGLTTDAEDRLTLQSPGQVVLSVPSAEALLRDPETVRDVIDRAELGTEPLVIEVEEMEVPREDELRPVLEAARQAERTVVLRVLHTGGG